LGFDFRVRANFPIFISECGVGGVASIRLIVASRRSAISSSVYSPEICFAMAQIPRSPLEGFPDYLRAIGMITVELCNLEAALCHLLDSILRTNEQTAGCLFFSPKTTAGRLDMVLNVSEHVLQAAEHAKVKGLVKRADKLLRKRNDVVHEIWGVSRDHSQVLRIPLPYGEPKPVQLDDLTRVI
jgi:hypothetical protein